jgi:hypothetical protein
VGPAFNALAWLSGDYLLVSETDNREATVIFAHNIFLSPPAFSSSTGSNPNHRRPSSHVQVTPETKENRDG